MNTFKNKLIVGIVIILILLWGVYIFSKDDSKHPTTDDTVQQALDSLAQNPFYGIQNREELVDRTRQYLIKRLNEGATIDEVKEEIKSYIVGAKLAEDYVVSELTNEALSEIQAEQ